MRKVTVAVLLLFALAACDGGDEGARVELLPGHAFGPSTITVAAGDTVRFVNISDESHTVTAYEEGLPPKADYFASGDFDNEDDARSDLARGLIRPDRTFEVTLTEPGTYRYFCIPHESSGMKGTIIVE